MTHIQAYIVLAILVTGSLALGQVGSGNLLYDIGLMIEDSSKAGPNDGFENPAAPELSQEEQVLEEELNSEEENKDD